MRAGLFILLAVALPAAGAEGSLAAPPSATYSALRVAGALCLVFSLLFAGVWAYRNSARFAGGRGRTAKLKVLETRALGHRHSIFVVGYEQQRLLLSTSPTGVTMISHLPEAPAAEPEREGAEASPAPPLSFAAAFMSAVAAGRK